MKNQTYFRIWIAIFVLVFIIGGSLVDQILTAKNTKIINNKDFIEWIEGWQTVKPSYTADTFKKVSEDKFSFNWEPINQKDLEYAIEIINKDNLRKNPYLPEGQRGLHYSPDKTKLIINAGYPSPFKINQDVVLFNLSTEKYQFLKTCGTACWFEKVFWINNNLFVVIRMDEYNSLIEHKHSVFLYDLEKKTITEYESYEIIFREERIKKGAFPIPAI